MTNKNYVKGRKFEYKIRDRYKALGYLVFRTAGSHSPADLIIFTKVGDWFRGKELGYVPTLIQCKCTSESVSKKETQELEKIAKEYELNALLVTKKKTIVIYTVKMEG